MYFAIYFLILQLLRDPVPTSLMFFLSLKHNHKQIQKKKSHWRHMESELCWVTLSEHRASLDVWLMYSVSLHRRKLIFPLPQLYLWLTSWLGQGICAPFPSFELGFCLVGPCASFHMMPQSLEFICTSALLCLENSVSLKLSTTSYSLYTPSSA